MKILGVDIGGSGIKGQPVDIKTGEVLAERKRIDTPRPSTPKAIAETLKSLVAHFSWDGPIGCGFPATIQNGIVRNASNIDKSWIGTDAASLFRQASGCPTYVVNDADAAGIAEMQFGAGKGIDGVVLLITIGTGLGSALFTDGHLVPNTEFGHLILHGDSAEKYASDSARKREGLSWKKWAKHFNEYLEHVDFLMSPTRIILGGGASKKLEKYEKYFTVNTEIVPAGLLNQAGTVGAAFYAGTRLAAAKVR